MHILKGVVALRSQGVAVQADQTGTQVDTSSLQRVAPIIGNTIDRRRIVHVADLVVNPVWHEFLVGGRPIELTRLEFRIIHLLAHYANQVVSYDRLISYAWGYSGEEPSAALLKTHISHLRSKAAQKGVGPLTIDSIVGVGYILRSTSATRTVGV